MADRGRGCLWQDSSTLKPQWALRELAILQIACICPFFRKEHRIPKPPWVAKPSHSAPSHLTELRTMSHAENGRAERLAPWIRALPLDQQVLITGSTLVLEEIVLRRGSSLPNPVDAVSLREETDPRQAALLARTISGLYADLEPLAGPDGVDENWRISNLTKVIAETIDGAHPASRGNH